MMKFFKKAKLAGAVAAAMAAGLAVQTAEAVNLSSNGLGEVALVPYYSARNGFDTYISIVNTDPDNVIAVKIRFRERDNSRDVRDFNIFLSPNDVWTGTVTMNTAGDTPTPVIQTNDNTCTAPALIPFGTDPTQATRAGMRGVAFTSDAYTGRSSIYPTADAGPQGIERTYDGHIEIIQMGHANPDVSEIAAQAVHGNSGVPLSCGTIVDMYVNNRNQEIKAQFGQPLNVMKVSANLINVSTGIAVSMPTTTLANFFNFESPDPLLDDIMNFPATQLPALSDAKPPVAVQVVGAENITPIDGVATQDDDFLVDNFGVAVDAVSSLLMSTAVINEYAIGGASQNLNDWVVTFPTKQHYVDSAETGQLRLPFSQLFGVNGSCERVSFGYFNREERNPAAPPGTVDFSPAPLVVVEQNSICQETNILAFDPNRSALTGADYVSAGNVYGVPLEENFTNGWMRLNFINDNATNIRLGGLASSNGVDATGRALVNHRYLGLPVIGFGLKTFTNGVAAGGGVRLDYGVTQEHAYQKSIIAF